jgi:hypothetical protein
MGGLEKSTKSYISVKRRRAIMIIDRIIPTRGELQKRFYETEETKTQWLSLCNE